MLWLDADAHRTLEEKVKRAVEYYKEKYGRTPTEAQVNIGALAEPKQIGSVKVIPTKNILPHHFWIGIGKEA
jgi:hypothetical protein